MTMAWGIFKQSELFPKASEEEIQQTEFYLEKYKMMRLFMQDFEDHEKEMAQVAIDGEAARRIDQDELHADKTANAVILQDKQKWVYSQYKLFTMLIDRAHSQVIDPEAKEAIDIRFIQGYSRKETIMFMRRGVASSTVDRRIEAGIESIAFSLKLTGFYDYIKNEF
ncbi:hypothetical protein MHH60_31450 [Paenibacillus sp. FSL H7-0716]|uniref:Uncharacterized protein n=1 Tax=Paenibacillus odorifer TaxID=189426 RepID=A0AB36J3X3_9BACL|nr:hypothetical protein [Paenibacillus odorifer]OME11399.1 hypothetical protein BSK47_28890 [Paenibacillus odorifer]